MFGVTVKEFEISRAIPAVFGPALGPDGSLWAGTHNGLLRRDKDGQWQTYSQTLRDTFDARRGRLPLGRNRGRPGAAR